MGISRSCQRLTVGDAPDSHRKLPSLSPLTVCGVLGKPVTMDWYSRSVSRPQSSLAACVSVSHGV